MDLFGTKKKEVAIAAMKARKEENEQLKIEVERLRRQLAECEAMITPEMRDYMLLMHRVDAAKTEYAAVVANIESAKAELQAAVAEYTKKKAELVELDDEILLQEYGLYRPLYDFATSEGYANRLSQVRAEQKQMIKDKVAAKCSINWTVNGDSRRGEAMTRDNIKQIIRTFNIECENVIDRVKFSNIDSMRERINKSYMSLNKLNEHNKIAIEPRYCELKMKELRLAAEYAIKKQAEKEELKRMREEAREEARVAREIEEARQEIAREQRHYANAQEKLQNQLQRAQNEEQRAAILERLEEVSAEIADLDKALRDVDYREANKKAGYVYIISNIGSFGENVYKIGMTRRLDPMERVDELGDASVPFNFDVHAMIFCDDAPALEAALHRAFDERKMNKINTRREFFRVPLSEIENVVRQNYDKSVDFVRVPPAEQYRRSLVAE